jgi:hypothetical protein
MLSLLRVRCSFVRFLRKANISNAPRVHVTVNEPFQRLVLNSYHSDTRSATQPQCPLYVPEDHYSVLVMASLNEARTAVIPTLSYSYSIKSSVAYDGLDGSCVMCHHYTTSKHNSPTNKSFLKAKLTLLITLSSPSKEKISIPSRCLFLVSRVSLSACTC